MQWPPRVILPMGSRTNFNQRGIMEECKLLCLTDLDDMDQDEKLEALDDAIHRLNFERRLAALDENQLKHMGDDSLNIHEKKKLKECETEEQRDALFTDFARTRYFRQCAWVDYLNGVHPDPPIDPGQ